MQTCSAEVNLILGRDLTLLPGLTTFSACWGLLEKLSPSPGLLVMLCGCRLGVEGCQHRSPPLGLHSPPANLDPVGTGAVAPAPGKPGSPVDPSSPPGPASHLPAPWAVTPCPVKAEEGEVSHERCPRGPGQRQAPDGRCQVVSIKAVPGGLGWGMAARGPV